MTVNIVKQNFAASGCMGGGSSQSASVQWAYIFSSPLTCSISCWIGSCTAAIACMQRCHACCQLAKSAMLSGRHIHSCQGLSGCLNIAIQLGACIGCPHPLERLDSVLSRIRLHKQM
eukprot:jgi/Botrbrau1/8193/Bobra.357_2s0036.1